MCQGILPIGAGLKPERACARALTLAGAGLGAGGRATFVRGCASSVRGRAGANWQGLPARTCCVGCLWLRFRRGVAACLDLSCPFDDQAAAGFRGGEFFGFGATPYARKIIHNDRSEPGAWAPAPAAPLPTLDPAVVATPL